MAKNDEVESPKEERRNSCRRRISNCYCYMKNERTRLGMTHHGYHECLSVVAGGIWRSEEAPPMVFGTYQRCVERKRKRLRKKQATAFQTGFASRCWSGRPVKEANLGLTSQDSMGDLERSSDKQYLSKHDIEWQPWRWTTKQDYVEWQAWLWTTIMRWRSIQ